MEPKRAGWTLNIKESLAFCNHGWMDAAKTTTSCARNAEDHRLLKSSGFFSISSVYDAQARMQRWTRGAKGQKLELGNGVKKTWIPIGMTMISKRCFKRYVFFKLILGCLKGSMHQIPGYPRNTSDLSSSGVSESTGIL